MKKIKNVEQCVDAALQYIEANTGSLNSDIKAGFSALVNRHIQETAPIHMQEVTILLSDIRGFTSLSERYAAADVVQMLNNYFSRMNTIINRYGGMIDKYMGDAIMVVFGVDDSQQDDPHRGVACAIEMQIAMDEVNRANEALGFPELFTGIGLNSGTVSAGRLGSDIHEEFTVIGDGVNLASRVESYTLRGQVLISQHTYEKVKDVVTIAKKNTVRVKGKSEIVELYEVTGIDWQYKHLELPRREVRSSIRLAMDTTFAYQIVKGEEVMGDVLEGHLRDISYDGLFAILDHNIKPQTKIRFGLSTSLLGGKTRDIFARIVSVRKMKEGYGCGIEFSSLDDDCKESIKSYIDRIIMGN